MTFNLALLNRIARIGIRSDLLIALLLILIIFMMILPLPTILVDTLIGLNISISVILLMVALYLKTPLEFATFPAVLLITTIFRLALAITTTRLILLEADAGKIVETFGNFVVGNNIVVGLVIFLIITIVQFLVITKGSERVAEVAARFTLDGMPGKQMSIDSDMRAGVIDMEEARRRRSAVEKESQLFGAMDGAMKFVKGDAIAGIIIIFVNMLGGLAIGMLQNGMPAGEALETYAILTIGDGLISQIPALIISLTAGIIVTRVSTDESTDLGSDVARQVTSKPFALIVGALLLLAFAAIPGFPTLIVLSLAALFGFGGLALMRLEKARNTEAKGESTGFEFGGDGSKPKESTGKKSFALTVPIIVEIYEKAKSELDINILNEEITNIRQALYLDLGVPFPGIQLRYSPNLEAGQYKILLQEVPIVEGLLQPNKVLVMNQEEQMDLIQVEYQAADNFLPSGKIYWIAESDKEALSEIGVRFMSIPRVITYHITFVLKKFAEDFLGIQETKQLMQDMEERYGELVKEVQRLLPTQKIAEIFQRLVSEDISIRNLRVILEALVEWAQKEKETVLLTEYVRSSLKRYISYKYSNGQNILPCYLLDQDLEDMIRNGIRQTSAGSYLALDPIMTNKIIQTISKTVGDLSRSVVKPVLIVSMDVRRYVRKMIEGELYDLPVISYQEVTQDITVQPIKRIQVPN
ncbi:MAG: type III secretion system export apparatus subunit SctV [Pseudomonadota bacterium]